MSQFFIELDKVRQNLLTMGSLVEQATRQAIIAVTERRSDLVTTVLNGDRKIDAYENDIDHECHRILALFQPVAKDLRLIITVLKVNKELERMGDHAKGIARCVEALSKHDQLQCESKLTTLSDQVLTMVHDALDATVREDAELAEKVRQADDEVDAGCDDLFARVQEKMIDGGEIVGAGVALITVARNLERIGDLATNIAKDVIFLVKGTTVRHGGITNATMAEA